MRWTVLLRPFSAFYQLVLRLRHRLYDRGVLSSRPGPVSTIVVGNLELGGTGKTPLASYILGLLQQDFRTGFLSRGYGRLSKGFLPIGLDASASQVGDEPLLLAQTHPQVSAAVCEDRHTGLSSMIKTAELDMVVLDDAFQHRKLIGGLNILVTPFDQPFWGNRLVPEGSLRDIRRRARAAHVVVVSKSPDELSQRQIEAYRAALDWYSTAPLFFTKIVYEELRPVFPKKESNTVPEKFVLFSAIADDSKLREYLQAKHELVQVERYRDHHNYSIADVTRLKQICTTFGDHTVGLLTTAKDAVKLRKPEIEAILLGIPVYYVPIKLEFLNPGFNEIITGYARANKRNRKLD